MKQSQFALSWRVFIILEDVTDIQVCFCGLTCKECHEGFSLLLSQCCFLIKKWHIPFFFKKKYLL